VEWIVFAIATMGFLNKFTDAVRVEPEQGIVDEVHAVIAPSGWHPGNTSLARSSAPSCRASTASAPCSECCATRAFDNLSRSQNVAASMTGAVV
jgi:hypothetical protein